MEATTSPDVDFARPFAFSKAELLHAIRHDCVTFFAFYLQEDLELEVPELHIEIWDELLGYLETMNRPGLIIVLKKLFAVPREHAKSTIAKLAVILFLKFSPLKFCLYVSKTNGNAKNAIRDIVKWLSSPQELELFGIPLEVIKSSETDSLWMYTMPTVDLRTMRIYTKEIIFRALGSRQQVRGLLIDNRRPELIIMDDIEDRDNTTQELQPELDAWVMGTLLKSFARRAFVLFIGNMIRETTLLARLTKEPEWSPTVFGSIVKHRDGSLAPLWPGRWTLEALLAEYAAYRRLGTGHVWEAEMLNLTQDAIFGESLGDYVRPITPMPENLLEACLILDPAGFGENPSAASVDSSAITAHARIDGIGIPVCIDSWEGKAGEAELFDQMIAMSLRWGISTWFIESVAAQRLFISYFKLLMKDRLMSPSMIQIYPVIGGKNTKDSRIVAARNAVKSKSYGIAESQTTLAERLAKWSPGQKHEDLEDSFAFGIIVWETNSMNITSVRNAPLSLHTLYSDSRSDAQPQTDYEILGY